MEWMFTGLIVGAIVSFLGSLPPGILNSTIIQITLRSGKMAAIWFALACMVVEIAYSYVAVLLATTLLDLNRYQAGIELLSTLLLLGAGVYYVGKKSTEITGKATARPFYLGVVLSLVNVVAVPFWVAYTSLLTSQGWITLMKNVNLTLYLTGIGLGTFLALALFAQLSGFLQKRFAISSTLMNRAVGWLMVATSLYQALHLII